MPLTEWIGHRTRFLDLNLGAKLTCRLYKVTSLRNPATVWKPDGDAAGFVDMHPFPIAARAGLRVRGFDVMKKSGRNPCICGN
jgi:hypothetical protein